LDQIDKEEGLYTIRYEDETGTVHEESLAFNTLKLKPLVCLENPAEKHFVKEYQGCMVAK